MQMALVDKNREPSRLELRIFGLLIAAFLGLVGWLVLRRTGSTTAAGVIWGLTAAIVVFYYAVPSARRMVYFAWMTAFYPLGWLISHVMLATIYFLVLTPMGLMMRLVRRDPLERTLEPNATSYWTAQPAEQNTDRYFRQF